MSLNGPSPEVVRPLSCGEAMRLIGCSHLAIRVYLDLFWGKDSERPGLGECYAGAIADRLDSSKRAVVVALNELQSAGLIEWSDSEKIASRVDFTLRYWPSDWPNRVNWSRLIMGLRDGFIANKLREMLADRIEAALKAASEATSKATSKATYEAADQAIVRKSDSPLVQETSSPDQNTTPTPSGLLVDVPVVKKAAKREPKQRDADIRDNPPTIEATVQLLIAEGCPNYDADRIARGCHGYWESQGWCRGKSPIKSWSGTVRNWLANQCERDRELAQAVRHNRLPEWQQRGFDTEQAYAEHQAVVAQRRAERLAEEERKRQSVAAFGQGLKIKQDSDDDEAEYRKNNPLPMWAFPTEPPADDEELPL